MSSPASGGPVPAAPLAMGRDRAFPRWPGVISERHRAPWAATILLGLLNVVFLRASALIGPIGPIGTALGDIVSTLGLMAAIICTDPAACHGDRAEADPAGPDAA